MEVSEDQVSGSQEAATVEGYVEAIVDDVLIGWAWRPAEPDTHLSVTVSIDEQPIGELVADQPSSKLAEAGIGHGSYSFRVGLPERFLNGELHEIAVLADGCPLTPRRARYDGSAGTQFVLVRAFSVPLADSSARLARIDGMVEAIVGDQIVGWAWSPDAPDEPIEVEVLLDGAVLGTTLAESRRDDLCEAGLGGGAHGFAYTLPDVAGMESEQVIEVRAGPAKLPLALSTSYRSVPTPPTRRLRPVRYSGAPPHRMPVPERALVGEQNWLFPLYDLGSTEMTEGAIELLVQRYEDTSRALFQLGIPYVLVVAPEKQDVYPELGGAADSVHAELVRSLQAVLRDSDWPPVLDLSPPLVDAKHHGPLYARTDSRWNARGAFFASRAIVKHISARVTSASPLPLDSARGLRLEGSTGDLAAVAKIASGGELVERDDWVESTVDVDATALRSVEMPAPEHLAMPGQPVPRLFELPDEAGLPRLAILGVCAIERIIPWLAEHSRRTIVISSHEPPLEPLELEAPDALVHIATAIELLALVR